MKELKVIISKDPLCAMDFVKIPCGSFMMGFNKTEDEQPIYEVIIDYSYLIGKYPVTQYQWNAIMGNNPSEFKGDTNPVEQVSWEDAQVFCKKLGKYYRLPNGVEWEYACRAGTQTRYYFGNDANELSDYAWYGKNSNRKTQAIGQLKPNNWGLYDILGNVEEWYTNERKVSNKPICRGAWRFHNENCNVVYRNIGIGISDIINNFVGFRVVVSSSETL